MTQIGFGYYSIFDSIRQDLYMTKNNEAYFCRSGKKYSFKLFDDDIKNINNGKKMHITLTKQNYSEIHKDGLQINPEVHWSNS